MIKKFNVNIPQSEIDYLNERIKNTRWPNETPVSHWKYGTSLSYLKKLAEYWEKEFDWRKIEEKINAYPNFIFEADKTRIHFIHIKSSNPNAIPLLITHGWPGSFLEMFKIIPLITDNFHLVIPSIPGFGFSGTSEGKMVDYDYVAALWHRLMAQLDYSRYGLQGGDLGAGISIRLAQQQPKNIIGLHLNYISDSYRPYSEDGDNNDNQEFLERLNDWNSNEGAYGMIHSTKPLSLAYGLNDSPVGLCAWIIEKFKAWSDNKGSIENCFTKEELLANVSLYWFTQSIYASIKIYYGIRLNPLVFKENDFVRTPVGFAKFPKEIPVPPKEDIEKGFHIVHWTNMDKGGHFAAMEQPKLFADDLKLFYKKIDS